MKYSESQAGREIDKISDQHAFDRYTIKAAMDDDDMAYLFECFFKHEIDLETGKLNHKALPRKTVDRLQSRDFEASLRSWSLSPRTVLLTEDTRLSQVYYETLIDEPGD
jgi:hypothetical protein